MKELITKYKDILLLSFVSLLIGIIVGAIDTVFGRVLISITDFRMERPFFLIPFLPLCGFVIIYLYTKIGKDSIKGMSLVFMAGHGEIEKIPKRLVPLTILTTWMTHLFGGSAGREGVAVQIGGAISHTIGRKLKVKDSKKILLVTGMAAGFAGLFQTPIAAIFFALEVLIAGSLQYSALLCAIIAAFSASFTSHTLGLEKFSVELNEVVTLNGAMIFKLIIIAIIFGIVGGLFAYLLNYSKKYFSSLIKNPLIKIVVMGASLSILLLAFHSGRYSGLGTNLISASFTSNNIYYYDWLLKFALTILTLAAGFQGGEVTPLFSIGASLGIVLASIFNMPPMLIAALGYASVFGSATNTLIAPIFIGAEVFGFEYVPYFFIVCSLAYIFNGSKSIYSAQKIANFK